MAFLIGTRCSSCSVGSVFEISSMLLPDHGMDGAESRIKKGMMLKLKL